jgi:hypothetical protein
VAGRCSLPTCSVNRAHPGQAKENAATALIVATIVTFVVGVSLAWLMHRGLGDFLSLIQSVCREDAAS